MTKKESDILAKGGVHLDVRDAEVTILTFENIDSCDIDITAADLQAGSITTSCGATIPEITISFQQK
jgi:hypothetical protein